MFLYICITTIQKKKYIANRKYIVSEDMANITCFINLLFISLRNANVENRKPKKKKKQIQKQILNRDI